MNIENQLRTAERLEFYKTQLERIKSGEKNLPDNEQRTLEFIDFNNDNTLSNSEIDNLSNVLQTIIDDKDEYLDQNGSFKDNIDLFGAMSASEEKDFLEEIDSLAEDTINKINREYTNAIRSGKIPYSNEPLNDKGVAELIDAIKNNRENYLYIEGWKTEYEDKIGSDPGQISETDFENLFTDLFDNGFNLNNAEKALSYIDEGITNSDKIKMYTSIARALPNEMTVSNVLAIENLISDTFSNAELANISFSNFSEPDHVNPDSPFHEKPIKTSSTDPATQEKVRDLNNMLYGFLGYAEHIEGPLANFLVPGTTPPAIYNIEIDELNDTQELIQKKENLHDTIQRQITNSFRAGAIPISESPITLDTLNAFLALNITDNYNGNNDELNRLRIDSWVNNLSESELGTNNINDVRFTFVSIFEEEKDYQQFELVQDLFENGTYDPFSYKSYLELYEEQEFTKSQILALSTVEGSIKSVEELNFIENVDPDEIVIDTSETPSDQSFYDPQTNAWVVQGLINPEHRGDFSEVLFHNNSITETSVYLLDLYDKLADKNDFQAYKEAHLNGVSSGYLKAIQDFSTSQGLSKAETENILNIISSTSTDESDIRKANLVKQSLTFEIIPDTNGNLNYASLMELMNRV